MSENVQPTGVIAIVRLRATEPPDDLLQALVVGGIDAVEITSGTPGALATVQRWRGRTSARIGIGTVRTAGQARDAVAAGAQFLVTPTLMEPVLQVAAGAATPVVCGAMTPTEIDTAWQKGVASVKVFPVDALGGPNYVRAVLAPLSDVALVPTGGVSTEHVTAYARLGCVGVGVGSSLVDEGMVINRGWTDLEERAAAFARAWNTGSGA